MNYLRSDSLSCIPLVCKAPCHLGRAGSSTNRVTLGPVSHDVGHDIFCGAQEVMGFCVTPVTPQQNKKEKNAKGESAKNGTQGERGVVFYSHLVGLRYSY